MKPISPVIASLLPCIAVQFYDDGIIPFEMKKKCCGKYKKKSKKACKSYPKH